MRTDIRVVRVLVAVGVLAVCSTAAGTVLRPADRARAAAIPVHLPGPVVPVRPPGVAAPRFAPVVASRVWPDNVLRETEVTVSGTVRPARAARAVTVQQLGHRGWFAIAHAVTNARGLFRVRVGTPAIGSYLVRVRFAGDALGASASSRAERLNVYRLAGASWYGPGGDLACGGVLTAETLGVANKTLPCGTWVTLHLGSRTVRVRVIDRGPYVAGRDFDLTPATKRALGFGDVGQIWASA